MTAALITFFVGTTQLNPAGHHGTAHDRTRKNSGASDARFQKPSSIHRPSNSEQKADAKLDVALAADFDDLSDRAFVTSVAASRTSNCRLLKILYISIRNCTL